MSAPQSIRVPLFPSKTMNERNVFRSAPTEHGTFEVFKAEGTKATPNSTDGWMNLILKPTVPLAPGEIAPRVRLTGLWYRQDHRLAGNVTPVKDTEKVPEVLRNRAVAIVENNHDEEGVATLVFTHVMTAEEKAQAKNYLFSKPEVAPLQPELVGVTQMDIPF